MTDLLVDEDDDAGAGPWVAEHDAGNVASDGMSEHRQAVWLAAARLESAQYEHDQATVLLREALMAALRAGEPLKALAAAAGLTPVEVLALTGLSMASLRNLGPRLPTPPEPETR